MNTLTIPTKDEIRSIVQEELSNFKPVIYPEPERFIDKEECAKLIGGVCISTIDNLRKRGVLKAYKVGNGVRFKKTEVIAAIPSITAY